MSTTDAIRVVTAVIGHQDPLPEGEGRAHAQHATGVRVYDADGEAGTPSPGGRARARTPNLSPSGRGEESAVSEIVP
jgi:hypothetical protein